MLLLALFSANTFAADVAPSSSPSIEDAFDSQLDRLRLNVTLQIGDGGSDSVSFHGKDEHFSCTIQTSGPHLNMANGVEQDFRYAGSETGVNENHEFIVKEVSFTNSGVFPATPGQAYIQCKGEFKSPKDVIRAFEGNDLATLSWAPVATQENKSLVHEISGALLSATKSLFGMNHASAERSISSAPLAGMCEKRDDANDASSGANAQASAAETGSTSSGAGL